MAARHPARQARVLGDHGRRWRPRGVLTLVRDRGHARPAALLAGNGNRIADRLSRLGDVVEAPVAEADDDLAFAILRVEAHHLATAAANRRAAAAPIEEQLLRRCRSRQRSGCYQSACAESSLAQLASNDHFMRSFFLLLPCFPACDSGPGCCVHASVPDNARETQSFHANGSVPAYPSQTCSKVTGVWPTRWPEATRRHFVCVSMCGFRHICFRLDQQGYLLRGRGSLHSRERQQQWLWIRIRRCFRSWLR
jgi:hypothetical protein